jgi:hypothetical protein
MTSPFPRTSPHVFRSNFDNPGPVSMRIFGLYREVLAEQFRPVLFEALDRRPAEHESEAEWVILTMAVLDRFIHPRQPLPPHFLSERAELRKEAQTLYWREQGDAMRRSGSRHDYP